jgi:AcrR family transcriptional regulator
LSLREKKVAKKKQDILRSAAKVLYEKGYHGATMEEIAAQLLMTKGSMYYYFKNKEDLLYQCHMMILETSLETVESIVNNDNSPKEMLRKAIEAHIELAINEQSLFGIIDKPEQTFTGELLAEIVEKRATYAKYFDHIIQQGINQGEFKSVDAKMARLIILGALNWTQQWHSPNGDRTIKEIANIFATYLLRILGVNDNS